MKWIFIAFVILALVWEVLYYIDHGEPTRFVTKALGLAVIVGLFHGVNWLALAFNRVVSRWINRVIFRIRNIGKKPIVAPTEKLTGQ